MEKYRLVNAYGNRVVYTNSEKEKDQLLKRGFYIQEAQPKVTAAPTAKKRKISFLKEAFTYRKRNRK